MLSMLLAAPSCKQSFRLTGGQIDWWIGMKNFTWIFAALVTTFIFETASASAAQCFESEIDVRTKKPFVSDFVYQAELQRWESFPRPSVGMIDLGLAYLAYKREAPRATIFRSDKAKHCYIGCAIGLATSQKVVDYVGWKKELDDIKDCSAATLFEEADYHATSVGGKLGALDEKDCALKCRDHFTKKRPASR